MRNAFWVISLGVIVAYLFFFSLGAFGFVEVLPVSVVIAVLAVLWGYHAWHDARHPPEGRDPRLVHARERRGF